jgi:hypothetical protein
VKVTRRELVIHALLCLALLACVFPGTALRGDVMGPGYRLLDFLPWKAYAEADYPHTKAENTIEFFVQFTGWSAVMQQSLAAGEWPLWNPLEHLGVPLAANYQSAVFYPPRVLHAFFELHIANTLYVLLKVWLCGFTAYLLARGMKLSILPSRVFAIGWMLCTYNMTWTYWAEVDVSAWLPIVMLGAERLIQGKNRTGFFALALGGVLILLAGHPETAFTASLGVGMYFVVRIIWEGNAKRAATASALALGAWALALAVCAIQIVPFAEYLQHSYTLIERTEEDPAEHSLSASALVSFLVPRFYGIMRTVDGNYWGSWITSSFTAILYPGLLVWFGVILTVGKGSTINRCRVLALLLPTIFSILMVLNHSLLSPLKTLPLVGPMWNFWFYAFPAFSLPLIGAIGLDRWWTGARSTRAIAISSVVIAAAFIAPVGLFLFHQEVLAMEREGTDRYVQTQIFIAGAMFVLTLAALALGRSERTRRLAAVAIPTVLAFDLLVAGYGLRPTTPRSHLYMDTELTSFFQSLDPPPRVHTRSATIPDGVWQPYGIEQWSGYDGMFPARIMEFREQLGGDIWESIEPVTAVNYYMRHPELNLMVPEEREDQFESVGTYDTVEVFRNKRAFPRAFFVMQTEVIEDEDAMFERMADPSFDPGNIALLEAPLSEPLPPPPDNFQGSAEYKRTNNTAVVSMQTNAPALLVLADAYFPGWRAYIDGEEQEIVPVYHILRGVRVPAGTYFVEFRYEPRSFLIGQRISLAAILVSGAAAAFLLYRRKFTAKQG